MQAFKAEIVLGLLLGMRHRAVRLALVLTCITVVVYTGGGGLDPDLGLILVGAFAAVPASRVLAPGAPLGLLAFGTFARVGVGRVIGVAGLVVPVTALIAVGVGNGWPPFEWWSRAVGYGLLMITAVAASSPWVGATSAGTFGVFCAWVGRIGPEAIAASGGPADVLVTTIWMVAPMSWRVIEAAGPGTHAVGIGTSVGVGLVVTCLSVRLRSVVSRRAG